MAQETEDANPSAAWLSLDARINGVKIYIAQNCKEAANRIELSSGTRLADTSETFKFIDGAAYEEGARLPREPWRSPTAQEAESLITAGIPTNIGKHRCRSKTAARVIGEPVRSDQE